MRIAGFSLCLVVAFAARAQPAIQLGDPRLALIDDPVRIEFSSGSATPDPNRMRQAVEIVAASKGWQVTPQGERQWRLELLVRGAHTARVTLACDDTGCILRYVDSANLLYREKEISGTRVRAIHRNYNNWVHGLADALAAGIGAPARLSYGYAPLTSVDALPFVGEDGRGAYREFLGRPKPRAFAIAPNGAWGSVFKSDAYEAIPSREDLAARALENCNRRGAGACRLYAVDDHVLWIEGR